MNSAVNQAHGQRDDVDDVLVAFWEWLRLQEARWRDGPDRKEFHFSPNIASGDPFLDAHRRPAVLQRPSMAWRVLRTVSWGFLFTVIVSAAVAWQSSDDTTRDLVRRWLNVVAGLGTADHEVARANASVAVEPVSKTTDAAPKEDTALLQVAPANQATLAPTAEVLTGLRYRFEAMGNDIAVMHRLVETLAARQERMAQDIATLQTAQQNIISSISRSSSTTGPSGKNVPRVVHSEAPVGSTSRPVPASAMPLR
jgi:cobalamin biosynthesis Mg chelatase CobN